MRSLSQVSMKSRSSKDQVNNSFSRNLDMASDKHTPFGIPANVKYEIKRFK